MLTSLLAHIAIPLVAGLCLVLFVNARKGITWASCNEIAIDLVLISIGATGALFLNPKLTAKWGPSAAIFGILIVLANLLFASVLAYRSHRRETARQALPTYFVPGRPIPGVVTWKEGYIDLFLGILGLVVTCLAYSFGYQE